MYSFIFSKFQKTYTPIMSLMLSDNLAPQPMTDVFTDDTNIDRRKCHRTVPMKVLALGVGRTGTACKCTIVPTAAIGIWDSNMN